MKTATIFLIFFLFSFVSCKRKPFVAAFPPKMIITGDDFWYDIDNNLLRRSAFLTEYDWTEGTLRESHAVLPGSVDPGSWERFYAPGAVSYDSYESEAGTGWVCSAGPLALVPPNWLPLTCSLVNYHIQVINHQLAYEWNCGPYGPINQTVYASVETGTILRQIQPPIATYPKLIVNFYTVEPLSETSPDNQWLYPLNPIPSKYGCDVKKRTPPRYTYRSALTLPAL